MPRLQVAELPAEGHDTAARIGGWHDASQIRAFSLMQVVEGFPAEGVKPTAGDVSLKLPVPLRRVALRKPLTECPKFVRRQLFNGPFDVDNG
jgi:hypothetical protein